MVLQNPITNIIPPERSKAWSVMAPESLEFYSDEIVVVWTEDALGNQMQPLMVRIAFDCCGANTEVGDGPGMRIILKTYVKYKGKWRLRNSAVAIQPNDQFKISNLDICPPGLPSGLCKPDVSPGFIYPTDLSAQVDQWILQASSITGNKMDFIPFDVDWEGCDEISDVCTGRDPGWYAQLYILGNDFFDPYFITPPLGIPGEAEAYDYIWENYGDDILNWLGTQIDFLVGLVATVSPQVGGVVAIAWEGIQLVTDIKLVFCDGEVPTFSCESAGPGWYFVNLQRNYNITSTPYLKVSDTICYPDEGSNGSTLAELFGWSSSFESWIRSAFPDLGGLDYLIVGNSYAEAYFNDYQDYFYSDLVFCEGGCEDPDPDEDDWDEPVTLSDYYQISVYLFVPKETGSYQTYGLTRGAPCSQQCFWNLIASGPEPTTDRYQFLGSFTNTSSQIGKQVQVTNWRYDLKKGASGYVCTASSPQCAEFNQSFDVYLESVRPTFKIGTRITTSSIVFSSGIDGLVGGSVDNDSYTVRTPPEAMLEYRIFDRATGRTKIRRVPLPLPLGVPPGDYILPPPQLPCCDYFVTPKLTLGLGMPVKKIKTGEVVLAFGIDLLSIPLGTTELVCLPDVPNLITNTAAEVVGEVVGLAIDTAVDVALAFAFPVAGVVAGRIINIGTDIDVVKQCPSNGTG